MTGDLIPDRRLSRSVSISGRSFFVAIDLIKHFFLTHEIKRAASALHTSMS